MLSKITDTVDIMRDDIEYDINVWTEGDMPDLHLVFYPLVYPWDDDYPTADLEHGLPVANYSKFYVFKIPKRARGQKMRSAYEYLMRLVNQDSYTLDFDDDYVEWTSCETILDDAPQAIKQFMATLPRRV